MSDQLTPVYWIYETILPLSVATQESGDAPTEEWLLELMDILWHQMTPRERAMCDALAESINAPIV